LFENHKKSQYKQGYDPKFKEPETIEILETAKDAIIGGYKKNTIAKLLCNELEMPYVQAQAVAAKAWKEVMQTGKDREEGMREKNIQRLEFLYARCVDQNDMKNALSALDQLSKLCMLYKDKIELSTEDFEFQIGGE
jgi:gluconate kinase